MFLDNEAQRMLMAILDAPDEQSFVALARLGGLDPAKAFRHADLTRCDFGDDDLTGFDFSGANLTGATLDRAKIDGLIWDDATIWPEGFTPPVRPEAAP